jgi:hypothetical protein
MTRPIPNSCPTGPCLHRHEPGWAWVGLGRAGIARWPDIVVVVDPGKPAVRAGRRGDLERHRWVVIRPESTDTRAPYLIYLNFITNLFIYLTTCVILQDDLESVEDQDQTHASVFLSGSTEDLFG